MKLRHGMVAALVAAGVAACAPTTQRPGVDSAAVEAEKFEQQKLVISQAVADSKRLYRVANRIAVAGVDFCPRKGWRMGFIVRSLADFPETQRKAAAAVIPDLGHDMLVTQVLPGSTAEAAGMKEGDRIVSLAGKPTPADSAGSKALRDMVKDIKAGDVVPVVLRRGTSELSVNVAATPACGYSAQLDDKQIINAFADGDRVIFTAGMMRFIQSDEELALVMGHEFAHNFRGHIDAKRGNAMAGQIVGTILDILAAAGGVNTGGAAGNALGQIGGGAFSQDFEAEADYAGLYVMAQAGYPIDDAPNFWRRMAVANPGSITHASSHPATPERFVSLNAAIKEIKAKQMAKQPLVPNEMPATATAPGHGAPPSLNFNP